MSGRGPPPAAPPAGPITDARDLAERLTAVIERMDEAKRKLSASLALSS
jgi:hypothetical protein